MVMIKRLKPDGFDRDHLLNKLNIMFNQKVSSSAAATFLDQLIADRVTDSRAILNRLRQLDGDLAHPEDIAFQLSRDVKDFLTISDFFSFLKIESDRSQHGESSIGTINDHFRQTLIEIFRGRIQILSNPFLSGDQVIDQVTRCLPPFHSVKMMGVQNIKGTGLDFAYRWVSLDRIKEAVTNLEHDQDSIRRTALDFLCDYTDYGILDAPLALQALGNARKKVFATSPEIIPVIDEAIIRIQRHLETCIVSLNARLPSGRLATENSLVHRAITGSRGFETPEEEVPADHEGFVSTPDLALKSSSGIAKTQKAAGRRLDDPQVIVVSVATGHQPCH